VSWTKALTAAIFLALLDAFLTNRSASTNVGGAETGFASILGRFLDPAVPALTLGAKAPTSSSPKSPSTTPSASYLAPAA
jgi:hypothetical protein